jgi:uncharacterized protein (TIGR02246 family)
MRAQTPEECDRLFAQHLNAGDIDALVDLYEPDGRLVQRDGRLASGMAAIRAIFERVIAGKPHIAVQIAKVVSNDRDLAIVYSDWRLVMHDDGGRANETAGKAIEVMRRQSDGSWRFALDDPFGAQR